MPGGSGGRLRLEWSGRAERGSAPHRAALVVARCNDDGDEERGDGEDDGRSGDEEDGGNDDDDDGGGDGEPAGDTRDGIRRVRASARRNLPVP